MPENNPDDQLLNLSHIQREFSKIASFNHWQAYHTPKNLAAAVAVEAGELLREFQWLSAEESADLSSQSRHEVAMEMADILMYLLALGNRLEINIAEALEQKITINRERFMPAAQSGEPKESEA